MTKLCSRLWTIFSFAHFRFGRTQNNHLFVITQTRKCIFSIDKLQFLPNKMLLGFISGMFRASTANLTMLFVKQVVGMPCSTFKKRFSRLFGYTPILFQVNIVYFIFLSLSSHSHYMIGFHEVEKQQLVCFIRMMTAQTCINYFGFETEAKAKLEVV